jgi:hypothetical protein
MQKERLVLWPIVILSATLALAMLTKGHNWGDDFAAYIMQAASVLHGTERQTIAHTRFTLQQSTYAFGPIATPWGFPTLLAPLYMACGGLNILCLKLINLPFFALFLLAFFPFLTRRLALFDSALVLSILAFSPALLSFQNNVLSDIAFLFFSTLSVLLIDRLIVEPEKLEGSPGGNVGLGIVLFLAFFVRSNGILLVATLFLTQAVLCFRRHSPPDWRRVLPMVLIPYLVFGLLTVALRLLFPSGEASSLAFVKAVSFERLADNASTYFALPVGFFDGVPYPFDNILYGTVLPFMIGGAVLHHKTDFHVLIYAGLTLLLYIVWPAQPGLRYLLPLLPFLIYFSYRGMQASAFALTDQYRRGGTLMTRALWMTILGVFLMTSFKVARANLVNQRAADDGPFEATSTKLFDFLKSGTAPDSVVIFFKPRAMLLMTGRDALLINKCDQLGKGNYVAIRKQVRTPDQVPAGDITTCNQSVDPVPVFENQRFVVYRILDPRSRSSQQ